MRAHPVVTAGAAGGGDTASQSKWTRSVSTQYRQQAHCTLDSGSGKVSADLDTGKGAIGTEEPQESTNGKVRLHKSTHTHHQLTGVSAQSCTTEIAGFEETRENEHERCGACSRTV